MAVFDSASGFEEEAFIVANLVESGCEAREVGFVFAKVYVSFGLDVNLADEVVAHLLDGRVDVFARAHHISGVVIHAEFLGIAEALKEFEHALVRNGGLDAEGDAVLACVGEDFFRELGDAGNLLFAFGEVRRAEEGIEENVAVECFAGRDGLLHDGEAFFTWLAFFPDNKPVHATGAERDDFDIVFLGSGEELLLELGSGEGEDALFVELAGVDLDALEACFLRQGNALDLGAEAECGLHDGEVGGRVVCVGVTEGQKKKAGAEEGLHEFVEWDTTARKQVCQWSPDWGQALIE